jgi:hypothetical protein
MISGKRRHSEDDGELEAGKPVEVKSSHRKEKTKEIDAQKIPQILIEGSEDEWNSVSG